jgi:hypothetical protein
MLVETQIISRQIRLAMCMDENEIARASLVIIKNDLHAKPYGLLEDMVGHKLGEFSPTRKFTRHGGKMQKELDIKKKEAEIAAAKSAKADPADKK